MPRAIDVPVMASGRLIFNVRGVDSNSTSLFFGGFVDLVVVSEFGAALA